MYILYILLWKQKVSVLAKRWRWWWWLRWQRGLCVCFAAFGWQRVVMRFANVSVQIARLCVASVAVATLIRPLPCVHDGVASQGVGARERFSTDTTRWYVLYKVSYRVLELLEVCNRVRVLLRCGWRNEGCSEGGSILGGRSSPRGGGGGREGEGVIICLGGQL